MFGKGRPEIDATVVETSKDGDTRGHVLKRFLTESNSPRVLCLGFTLVSALVVSIVVPTTLLLPKSSTSGNRDSACGDIYGRVLIEVNASAECDDFGVIQVYQGINHSTSAPVLESVQSGSYLIDASDGLVFWPDTLPIELVTAGIKDSTDAILTKEVVQTCEASQSLDWCQPAEIELLVRTNPTWEWPCAIEALLPEYDSVDALIASSDERCTP
ncbi:hypothetical protein IV203_014777 [Nitzschia inconspicua]|uniref:Uncharacterized protein n=1 Tax=Nitzschia inconspicua TaxID=303405 RepID=A0A9K3L9J1_9STRA|nr:hypothetical protein IV203_020279 [Nitzschia inconspicua]KAG7358190.1 hypothetical protein IV203_014777 [Nitzschia inconspicua]